MNDPGSGLSSRTPQNLAKKKLPTTALSAAYINAPIVRFEETFEPYSGAVF